MPYKNVEDRRKHDRKRDKAWRQFCRDKHICVQCCEPARFTECLKHRLMRQVKRKERKDARQAAREMP